MFLNRFKLGYLLPILSRSSRISTCAKINMQNGEVSQVKRVTRSAVKRKVRTPVSSPAKDDDDEETVVPSNKTSKKKSIKVELVEKVNKSLDFEDSKTVSSALGSVVKAEPIEEEEEDTTKAEKGRIKSSRQPKRQAAKVKLEREPEESDFVDQDENVKVKKMPKKSQKSKTSKSKIAKKELDENATEGLEDSPKSKKKASKVKKETAEAAPKIELIIPDINIPVKGEIVHRLQGPSPHNGTIQFNNKVYLGAHISAAGGLENAITNAIKIGATCFALFLKSQRQWTAKPMEESTVEKFKAACAEHNFSPHLILPHGSYLMNLGSQDPVILNKSRATLLDEVRRCDRLGILHYNIHPGSTCGKGSREESIRSIADSINWVHQETPGSRVSIVLENMCRQGNTIGGDLSELAAIIELVFDRTRVGVCLDTCHALAAGYDLVTDSGFQAFLDEFEKVVGFRYLVAVHLNDSEGELGCHRDRHASIGKGHIGRSAGGFRRIINCPRFRDIPLILETPYINDQTYIDEILHLKSLAEKDTVCA